MVFVIILTHLNLVRLLAKYAGLPARLLANYAGLPANYNSCRTQNLNLLVSNPDADF